MACSSHHATLIAYTVVAWLLSHLVKRTHAGGCRTGSALHRCLLAHVSLSEHGLLGALGLQAGRFCASQAARRDGLLLFIFFPPVWFLVPACLLSQRMGGLIRAPRESVTLRNGHRAISALLLFWIEKPRVWWALNCRAAFCCGQTLPINISLSAELGPCATDTELPEAADLHYQY